MRGRAVHQLLAGFAMGDAISHEALAIRAHCRTLGLESEIFAPASRIAPDATGECRPLDVFRATADAVIINHYSIASPATECFLDSDGRRVLIYHNITPPSFFEPYDTEMVTQLTEARRDLSQVASRAHAIWADSAFNAAELEALGFPGVRVFPLLFDPTALDHPPDARLLQRFSVPMRNILFVGRVAPNKCLEELIAAFACYHRQIEPQSRLLVVGSDRSAPAYYAMLKMYAAELELDTVFFERFVSPSGLVSCYQLADCFVTTSRHEGYCLPLVEAMYKGVPVIARNTGGTPEAMGQGGILIDDFSAGELAELMGLACTDAAFRKDVLASQAARMADVLARPVRRELESLLAAVIPAASA